MLSAFLRSFRVYVYFFIIFRFQSFSTFTIHESEHDLSERKLNVIHWQNTCWDKKPQTPCLKLCWHTCIFEKCVFTFSSLATEVLLLLLTVLDFQIGDKVHNAPYHFKTPRCCSCSSSGYMWRLKISTWTAMDFLSAKNRLVQIVLVCKPLCCLRVTYYVQISLLLNIFKASSKLET